MNTIRKHPANRILIDYPSPHETLQGAQYTFRIRTAEVACVEVSVDGGNWRLCREAVGFWWFDWACTPGEHALKARLVQEDGSILVAGPRQFTVKTAVAAPALKA